MAYPLKLPNFKPLAGNPVVWLYYLGVLTVSFDIFLVINLGFNFRFAQFAWGLPIAAAFLLAWLNRRIPLPLGFLSLWLWFLFILAFTPNTTLLTRSIGYAFWLIYNIALIVATICLFDSRRKFLELARIYLLSYLAMAWFGLYQFIAPFLHLPAPFVEQWWFREFLPRINGFTYEPSYYASYLLMGWVVAAYLIRIKSDLFSVSFLRTVFYSTGLALFLSSSRMGWLMMLLWYLQYPLLFIARLLRRRVHIPYFKASLLLLAVGLVGAIGLLYVVGLEKVAFLIDGLGIGGSSAHSSGARTHQLMDTLQAFAESPLIGYSLGGIASAVGHVRGVVVDNLELAKSHEGMAVFAEVLAASGWLGFVPFAVYMGSLIWAPLRRAKFLGNDPMANLLRALVLALVFELAILQFNQNILRLYLWLHIAVLSAAYRTSSLTCTEMCKHPSGRPTGA